MTSEKLQKALELQSRIESLSFKLDKLDRLNQRHSGNALSVYDEEDYVIDLHFCDPVTHEILGLLIGKISLERTKLIEEFVNTKALMNQGLGVIRPPL